MGKSRTSSFSEGRDESTDAGGSAAPPADIEAALRESEARYRTYLNLSQEGIWRFELDEPVPADLLVEEQVELLFRHGFLAECNAAFARMYGFDSPEEIVGARLRDLVPPDDPANRAYLQAFIENGYHLSEAQSNELDREGTPRVISNTLTGYVEDGMIVRAWGTQRDVTERVATERALRASEERFRLAASNEAVTMFEQDQELRYTWVYPQHPEFPDANIGRTDADLIPGEASRGLMELKRQVLDTGIATRREMEVPLPSGTRYYDLVIEPLRDAEGRVVGVAGIALDVTARRAAEVAVREGQERYRIALEATVGIVYEWALETGTTTRSEGLFELLGFEPSEVPSTFEWWVDRVHPDDRARLLAIAAGEIDAPADRVESEYRVRHRDGRWVDVLDRAVIVRDAAGKAARVVGHTADITERRRAERHRTFLTALDAALRLARTQDDILAASLDGLPGVLGGARCTYGEVEVDDDRLTVAYSAGVGAAPKGTSVPYSAFIGPAFIARVEAGSTVVVSDVSTDPNTRDRTATFAQAGAAQAVLVVPILRERRWVAALAVASQEVRTWMPDEVALAEAVAARIGPALERARAEDALRESEMRFRVLGEALPILISLAGPDGQPDYVNPYWESLTGHPAREFTWDAYLGAVHPDDRPRVEATLRDATASAASYEEEYRLRAADGSYRWMLARGLPVRAGGDVVHWVHIAADIHDRKVTEAALVASERQLRVIADAMPALIAYVDSAQRYRFANRAYTDWFGADAGATVGRQVREVIGEKAYEAVRPAIESALAGQSVTFERPLPYRDVEERVVRATYIPDIAETGESRGYFALLMDVTGEHRRAEELRSANEALAQANETLEARVAERTSDMRRYQERLRGLVSRLGRAEQLERQRLAAELHDHLAQVLTGARFLLSAVEADVLAALGDAGRAPEPGVNLARLQDLLHQALQHTRALMDDLSPPPALQQDDLVAAIRWVVSAAEKMGMEVTLDSDEQAIPLERESITVVYQSVRELLLNVLKHASTTTARISVQRGDNVVRVKVSDDGVGFEPAPLPRPGEDGGFGLFHLDERLGLIGGRFELRSAPDEGTLATIEIPLGDAPAAPASRRASAV